MPRFSFCWLLLPVLFNQCTLVGQNPAQKMSRENAVDVAAMGEGLYVSNVFQSNMVLQRDKPVSILGWADAGEKVVVSFGGHEQTATAADHSIPPRGTVLTFLAIDK